MQNARRVPPWLHQDSLSVFAFLKLSQRPGKARTLLMRASYSFRAAPLRTSRHLCRSTGQADMLQILS